MFIRTGAVGSTSLFSRERSTRYSERLHDFSVTSPRCYKDVYVSSFFPHTARPWGSLPIDCFPLTYNLNGFKSRINTPFVCWFFLNIFLVLFNLLALLILVTPCLVVASQPYLEWIPIKEKSWDFHGNWTSSLELSGEVKHGQKLLLLAFHCLERHLEIC